MKQYDVTALGELLIDFTENGTSAQGNPLLEANPGGAPCNVLAMLEKLGKKTAFIGKVGKDMFGEQLKTAVEEVGIDTRNLVMDEEVHTTLAFVHTYPDGDRDFSFYRNPGADMMLKKEEVDEDLIRGAKIFHFGTLSSTHEGVREATRYAIDVAKEAGCIVVLNAAPAIELPEECLSKVDILVVNEVEAEFYCHEKIDSVEKAKTEIKKMAEKYNNNVIFTLGKDGAVAYENGTIEFIPAMKVDAIETTGAGDSFIGSLLYQVAEGEYSLEELVTLSEEKVQEILTFSNATAALTVCKKGAIGALPLKEEVLAKISER